MQALWEMMESVSLLVRTGATVSAKERSCMKVSAALIHVNR